MRAIKLFSALIFSAAAFNVWADDAMSMQSQSSDEANYANQCLNDQAKSSADQCDALKLKVCEAKGVAIADCDRYVGGLKPTSISDNMNNMNNMNNMKSTPGNAAATTTTTTTTVAPTPAASDMTPVAPTAPAAVAPAPMADDSAMSSKQ